MEDKKKEQLESADERAKKFTALPKFTTGGIIALIGGADIFLDHSGSTYIIPKLSLYSTGLMPPKVILIRSSLYQ